MNPLTTESTASYCDRLAHQNLKEERHYILKSYPMRISASRRVAYCKFDPPMSLSGDIKISIKAKLLPVDRNSFVWFNTNFITDRVTIFSVDEVDLSKSSSSSSSSFSSSSSSSSSSSFSSLSSSTSTRSAGEADTVYGIAPDGTEQRFQIRCLFSDNELLETEDLLRLQNELANSKNDELEPVPSLHGSGIFQKAQSFAYKLARVSPVPSLTGVRSVSPPLSSHQNSASSLEESVSRRTLNTTTSMSVGGEEEQSGQMLEMVGRARSANGINTELVMRDKSTVALRQKMKMKSLHESEEYKHSLNSRTTKDTEKEGEKHRRESESSDEIYLDPEEEEVAK